MGASSDAETQAIPAPPEPRGPRRGGGKARRTGRLRNRALWHLALGLSACGVTILVGAVVLRGRDSRGLAAAAPAEGNMTRDEAIRLSQGYAEAHGVKKSPGLNDKNLGGLEVGGQTVYYEYQPEAKRLECGALIYRFNKPPRDKVLEGFRAEEAAGTDTGGGTLYYEPRNQGLFLRRYYRSTVPQDQFNRDVDRLRKAASVWADEVLDRVATKVFG